MEVVVCKSELDMLMGQIVVRYQMKLTNSPLKQCIIVPNKRAGRNFSAKLINMHFLMSRAGREKSQKLIKCAAQLFRTRE